jgi:hypothetical protein
VVAPAPPAVAAAPASLGEEQVKRTKQDREAETGAANLTAQVTALRETRKDVFRISLDNGQVWQQMDLDSLFRVEVGDTVRIERGAMGGYRMARSSGSRSGWTRVTRLK